MPYNTGDCANHIVGGVWVGDDRVLDDPGLLLAEKITHVFYVGKFRGRARVMRDPRLRCHHMPFSEKTVHRRDFFRIAQSCSEFIENALARKEQVIVVCKRGHRRSASLVVCWMLGTGQVTTSLSKASGIVRDRRARSLGDGAKPRITRMMRLWKRSVVR